MSLRLYQVRTIDQIRAEWKKGHKRVLLVMPTGSGKTVVFCELVKKAISRGMHAAVVVRGRKLVDQASSRLIREHVDHGVLMNGHWNYRPHLSTQVCSIDTLISRRLRPRIDLLIIDEAHLATSDGYRAFLADYPDAYIVAVTATPYCPGGLRHVADVMVRPISMTDLVSQGYLVPFRYFAPSEPDLTGVKIVNRDFKNDQLEERMVAGQLTGSIIEHWKRVASDRPTLLFAVNIHHSKMLVERFLAAGVRAEHCDADTSDKERNEIIKKLEDGRIQIICNVGIFCTGVDIPGVQAIILARPTKSRNLFVQQSGRGTRTSSGKRNCILLDHAGNIGRHGFPTLEPGVDLDGKTKVDSHQLESKTCRECFAVYRGPFCPECGVKPPEAPKQEIIETNEELIEIGEIKAQHPIAAWFEYYQKQRGTRKYGWECRQLVAKFGIDDARPFLPAGWLKWYDSQHEATSGSPFSGSPYRGSKK